MTREEAIKWLSNLKMDIGKTQHQELWHYEQALDEIMQALEQEPICCKDCKYWQDNNNGYPVMDCRWNKDETPDADDYCSFAERTESDEE